MIDTHNAVIDFGKHTGERWTRLPISYLKWLVNIKMTRECLIHNEVFEARVVASAELNRRGHVQTDKVEVSSHALDRLSQEFLKKWQHHRRVIAPNEWGARGGEGLVTWATRVAAEAFEKTGEHGGCDEVRANHLGICWVFGIDTVLPIVKTVKRA